jgi:hypothetical protein
MKNKKYLDKRTKKAKTENKGSKLFLLLLGDEQLGGKEKIILPINRWLYHKKKRRNILVNKRKGVTIRNKKRLIHSLILSHTRQKTHSKNPRPITPKPSCHL